MVVRIPPALSLEDVARALASYDDLLEDEEFKPDFRAQLLIEMQRAITQQYRLGVYSSMTEEEYVELNGCACE